jgi:hypothetical protein
MKNVFFKKDLPLSKILQFENKNYLGALVLNLN